MSKQNGEELTVFEYYKISKQIKTLNILGISGGEPFLRKDLSEIIKVFLKNCKPIVIDLPTNGFYTDEIIRQVDEILPYLEDTTLDVQLSLDGPEAIHDEIRGLDGSFKNMKETYKQLLLLRNKSKNLKIKICTVYSHYNQDYIFDIFDIINREFNEIDRFVFSVVHGSVNNQEALDINWNMYFTLCLFAEADIKLNNKNDFHNLFTRALRKSKNKVLMSTLKNNDMYKKCEAGKRVIVINEVGDVLPCEPLWLKIGNLRENEYDINQILKSSEMKCFLNDQKNYKCSCHWGLPMSNNLLYSPKYYTSIICDMLKRGFCGR